MALEILGHISSGKSLRIPAYKDYSCLVNTHQMYSITKPFPMSLHCCSYCARIALGFHVIWMNIP